VLCGRFEGVDQRVIEARALEEVSIGDFILSGGEPAALVLLDAVVRLLPGVLGAETGASDETFAGGLIEYPQYTRPRVFRGVGVPDVLLGGNHAAIARWRHEQRLRRTQQRRPDLWQKYQDRQHMPDAGTNLESDH
jgi:tRNA (guanine37-N1)-methyltransferase